MKKPTNVRLTYNFWLYEFLFGTEMPKQAHDLNLEYIEEFEDYDAQGLADDLQQLRNEVNVEFQDENNGVEIGLEITAGFRCLMWEMIRKRSGQSRHRWDGVDVRPTKVSPELSDKIIYWFRKRFTPRVGGWEGGFAIAEPKRDKKNPKNDKTGFGHFDRRGVIARWTYPS